MDEKIKHQVEEWDIKNPEMRPLNTPDGYDVKYLYKQPVICYNAMSEDFVYEEKDGWCIIILESNHEFDIHEKIKHQNRLKKEGMSCISNMRLVKQVFTLSKKRKE